MRGKRCLTVSLILGGFILVMVVVVGVISVIAIKRYLDQKRTASTAPIVVVHSPQDGEILPVDNSHMANITASGMHPIARVEMWLDEQLSETQVPDPTIPGGMLNFAAMFNLSLEEGFHMLYWRAVDSQGLVGQSQVISIEVVPNQSVASLAGAESEETALEGDAGGQPSDTSTQPQAPPANAGALPGGQAPPQDVADLPGPQDIASQPPSLPPGATTSPKPEPPPGVKILKAKIPTVDLSSLISLVASNMPAAPSNLQVGFDNCSVRLVWYDNATNETGFNVWMQRLGGPPQLVSTLAGGDLTGPVMYEIPAPPFGIYSVWVEAVNGVFAQPSEIKGLAINDANCPQDALAGLLEIEALNMYVQASFPQIYCYVSLEGGIFQRIPTEEGKFIKVSGITGEIQQHWSGERHRLIPIPLDGEVSIQGKCLGMGTNGPVEIGQFQASVPQEQWDGRRLELQGDGQFVIGYRIRLFGPQQVSGTARFVDLSIPQPIITHIGRGYSPDPAESARMGRNPTISWKWEGDPSGLRGFNILLDGKYFASAPANTNSQPILLPTSCGASYNFQMEANYGGVFSLPGPVYPYQQVDCKVYAEVIFNTISFDFIDDGEDGYCDTAEVQFKIRVDSIWREFGNRDNPMHHFPIGCDRPHSFKEFEFVQTGGSVPTTVEKSVDRFIVPIDPAVTSINITAIFEDVDIAEDLFWDDFDFLCSTTKIVSMPYDDWASFGQLPPLLLQIPCPFGWTASPGFDARGVVNVTVRGISSPVGP